MGTNIGGIGNNNSAPDLRANAASSPVPQMENQAVEETGVKGEQKITQQTMGQILKQLGIPDTVENQQLAKALLEYNLPLNKETLRELSRLLKQLGGEGKENANLLAFLKSKNIPLGKELFQTIKQFLVEKNLVNLLNKYLQLPQPELEKEFRAKLPLETTKTWQEMPKEILEKIENQLNKFLNNSNLPEKEKLLLGKFVQQLTEEENLDQAASKTLKAIPREVLEKLEAQLKELINKNSLPEKEKMFFTKLAQQLEEIVKNSPEKVLSQQRKGLEEAVRHGLQTLLENSDLPEDERIILTKLFQQLKNRGEKSEQWSQSLARTLEKMPAETLEKLQSQLKELIKQNDLPEKEKLLLNRLAEQLKELGSKRGSLWQTLLTESPKEAKELAKLLRGLVVDGKNLDQQELVMNLKKLLEGKKELLQGKYSFLAEHLTGGEKEVLAKLLLDLKGSLETESLLKYYQIPVLIQEKLYQAGLKICQEEQGRSGDQEKGDRLVISLETENLGQIKIDLMAHEQSLAFCFGVEEESIRANLESNLPELTERLEALGYQIKEATCSLSQEKPEDIYLELEKKVILAGFKKVDILT